MESAQLAALLHKLSTHLRPDVVRVIKELAETLATSRDHSAVAETLFARCRTKRQREALLQAAKALSSMAALADAQSDLQAVASALSAPPAKPTARKPKSPPGNTARKATEVVPVVVDRFAAVLADARLDRDRFLAIHQQLKDNKRINTATLHRIAQVFLGNDRTYSGRKQALEDILRRHHDSLRVAEQDRMLDRLS